MGITISAPPASKPWLTLPDGWNTAWKAAKAASGGTPAWVTMLGDSIAQGSVCTDFVNLSYFGLLRAYLKGLLPLYGDYYPTTESADWVGQAGGTYAGTPPWVIATTGRSWIGWGLYYQSPFYSSANNVAAQNVFTLPYAVGGAGFDIVYFDANAGTWKFNVNGGADTTVTTTGARIVKRVNVPGALAAGAVVNIGKQSGDAVLMVSGICTYAASGGIGYAKVAAGGASLRELSYNINQPADRTTLWQGQASGTTGFGFPTQPSLAVIALGVNDCQAYFQANGFKRGLVRAVEAFRRGVDQCSVILVVDSNPNGVNSDVTSPFANAGAWDLYSNAMQTVAKDYCCACLNVHARWGNTGVAKGFQTTSQPHPTNAGHADIAALLEGII